MGAGAGCTHITSYLPENVPELLLLLAFLVSVARPWLWKHKRKWFTRIKEMGRTVSKAPSGLTEPQCLKQP